MLCVWVHGCDPGRVSDGSRSVSTIGGGGDTTVPSPGMAPKQPLPGIGLHDPLYGRQACPESNSFHRGVGQIRPPEGLFSCRPLPKRGQNCYIPAPPPLNDAAAGTIPKSLYRVPFFYIFLAYVLSYCSFLFVVFLFVFCCVFFALVGDLKMFL